MNYTEAYNKIIDAYFKDKINPGDAKFCFCGTLCNRTDEWYKPFAEESHFDSNGYTGVELFKMERALLDNLAYIREQNYEDDLFEHMCDALDILKEIHRSRGENVDEVQIKFVKRELVR